MCAIRQIIGTVIQYPTQLYVSSFGGIHEVIQLKLIIIFLAAAIALGALIGVFAYSHSKNIVVANKKKEMADTVNRIDININVRVRYIMDAAENAATSHLVQDLYPRQRAGGTRF